MRPVFLALLLLFTAEAGAEEPAPGLERGREMSALFLQRKISAVWQRMSLRMQQALGSEAKLEAFRERVAAQLGDEIEVIDERAQRVQELDVYVRIGRWNLADRVAMQWAFGDHGEVMGFLVRPESGASTSLPSANLDYQTHALLRLPFEGEWQVVWGGRTLEQNHHATNRQQRFAYDLLIVRNGSTHTNAGKALEDYYCWNQPIRAPAKAVVSSVVDGLPDQQPGAMDPTHPPGNHVVLELGHDEYAFLAHLRQGSAQVKAGDSVERGQVLGRCGNSGNTTEPHLHFHLQNSPRFGDGEGLPAFFVRYKADGRLVERGEPLRGQRIESE